MIIDVIDLTQSGQFHIITYLKFNLSLIIGDLIYLTFLVNLYNQTFELTFSINLHWIGGAICLCYILITNMCIWKDLFLAPELYMIQVVNFLTDPLLVELWGIPLSSTLGGGEDERPARRI